MLRPRPGARAGRSKWCVGVPAGIHWDLVLRGEAALSSCPWGCGSQEGWEGAGALGEAQAGGCRTLRGFGLQSTLMLTRVHKELRQSAQKHFFFSQHWHLLGWLLLVLFLEDQWGEFGSMFLFLSQSEAHPPKTGMPIALPGLSRGWLGNSCSWSGTGGVWGWGWQENCRDCCGTGTEPPGQGQISGTGTELWDRDRAPGWHQPLQAAPDVLWDVPPPAAGCPHLLAMPPAPRRTSPQSCCGTPPPFTSPLPEAPPTTPLGAAPGTLRDVLHQPWDTPQAPPRAAPRAVPSPPLPRVPSPGSTKPRGSEGCAQHPAAGAGVTHGAAHGSPQLYNGRGGTEHRARLLCASPSPRGRAGGRGRGPAPCGACAEPRRPCPCCCCCWGWGWRRGAEPSSPG